MKKNNSSSKNSLSRRDFLTKTGISAGFIALNPVLNLSAKVFGTTKSSLSDGYFNRNEIYEADGVQPWPLKIEGDELIIPSGVYPSEVQNFKVEKSVRLRIKPATIKHVKNEELFLSKNKPSGYWIGTPLLGPRYDGLDVYCSFIEDSLTITDTKGKILKKGDDYLVSPEFSLLGLGTNTKLTPKDKVFASYSYYMQRIDSIAIDNHGIPFLIEGTPTLVCPPMPELHEGTIRFCNIYRPILSNDLREDHLFPILSSGKNVVTDSTKGRINKTLKKLLAGESVNIVAWGDSITYGSNVKPDEKWAAVLYNRLKEKFPKAKINFTNHSIGGTRSMQWLYDGNFPGIDKLPADKCTFKLVADDKPDLIIMEFCNDTVLKDNSILAPSYEKLKNEIDKLGAELIINTSSRFMTEDLKALMADYNSLVNGGYNREVENMKKTDARPYISFVKQFANRNNYAVADASSRWDHLYKEGIPYISILINAYNHPNPFGHLLYVEEQLKCFE